MKKEYTLVVLCILLVISVWVLLTIIRATNEPYTPTCNTNAQQLMTDYDGTMSCVDKGLTCATGDLSMLAASCLYLPRCYAGGVYDSTAKICNYARDPQPTDCPTGYLLTELGKCAPIEKEVAAPYRKIQCGPGYHVDQDTCKCVRDVDPTCIGTHTYNKTTGKCEWSDNGTCNDGDILDSTLKKCKAQPQCPAGMKFNALGFYCELVNKESDELYDSTTIRIHAGPTIAAWPLVYYQNGPRFIDASALGYIVQDTDSTWRIEKDVKNAASLRVGNIIRIKHVPTNMYISLVQSDAVPSGCAQPAYIALTNDLELSKITLQVGGKANGAVVKTGDKIQPIFTVKNPATNTYMRWMWKQCGTFIYDKPQAQLAGYSVGTTLANPTSGVDESFVFTFHNM